MRKLKNGISNIRTLLTEETPIKYGAVFAVIIIITLLMELFVFNFKWINSVFSEPVYNPDMNLSGITETGDKLEFNSDNAVIEFKNLNQKLKYIYFKPGNLEKGKAEITVSAIDEANSSYLSAPPRTVLTDVPMSNYIRLNFRGEVKDLKITVKDMNGSLIKNECIGLNVHVPLMFSWFRLLLLSLFIMIIYLLRPKSFIYKYKTDLNKNWQKVTAIILVAVQAIIFWNMIHWNTTALNWHKSLTHHQQYYELIDAFKDGHLYLKDDASKEMTELDNPYDTRERELKKVTYKWDHAYYDGKYYVYFGAAPAILLYLPYNLITGNDLPNYIAVFIFGIMIMIGILLLLWEIIKKWFRNTPFALYLLLSVVFGAAACLAYAVQKPDFYLVPSLGAIMFGLFGLAFWLSAERKNEDGTTSLISWRLVIGSACVAMIAGCRPQLLVVTVFGIILFWNSVFKERTLFSKKSLKQTVAVCLPFVIVGAAVMWYNYARFGSPFDFGANYNLTTNDMTKRGFVWGRTGLGIFTYLLQPFNMDAVFPFIHDFNAATVYQGLTLTEMLMGGVLWLYPILVIGLYGAFKKNSFSDRRSYRFVYFSVIFAVILAILDAQMAGLLTRYFTDFVWIAFIGTIITAFAYYEMLRDNEHSRRKFAGITLTLSVITLVLCFLSIFAHTEDSIMKANPTLYFTVQHLIAFWM